MKKFDFKTLIRPILALSFMTSFSLGMSYHKKNITSSTMCQSR